MQSPLYGLFIPIAHSRDQRTSLRGCVGQQDRPQLMPEVKPDDAVSCSSAKTSLQHTDLMHPPERGGCGLDAPWNDNFHHSGDGDNNLLLVNFGRDLDCRSIPDPLVAPPEGCTWAVLWSSEHPACGGTGPRR